MLCWLGLKLRRAEWDTWDWIDARFELDRTRSRIRSTIRGALGITDQLGHDVRDLVWEIGYSKGIGWPCMALRPGKETYA